MMKHSKLFFSLQHPTIHSEIAMRPVLLALRTMNARGMRTDFGILFPTSSVLTLAAVSQTPPHPRLQGSWQLSLRLPRKKTHNTYEIWVDLVHIPDVKKESATRFQIGKVYPKSKQVLKRKKICSKMLYFIK